MPAQLPPHPRAAPPPRRPRHRKGLIAAAPHAAGHPAVLLLLPLTLPNLPASSAYPAVSR